MSEAWKAYCDGLDAKCLKLARSIKEPGVVTETTYHNSTPNIITLSIVVAPGYYDGESNVVFSAMEGGRRRGGSLNLRTDVSMNYWELPDAHYMSRMLAKAFWALTMVIAEQNKIGGGV